MAKMIRAIPWALQHAHACYRELSILWSPVGSHSDSGELRTPARPEPNIFPSCQLRKIILAILHTSPYKVCLLFFPYHYSHKKQSSVVDPVVSRYVVKTMKAMRLV